MSTFIIFCIIPKVGAKCRLRRVQRDFYAQVMLRSDGVLAVERWWVGLDGEDAVATQVCAKSYMCFFKIVKNKGLDRINLPLHPLPDFHFPKTFGRIILFF